MSSFCEIMVVGGKAVGKSQVIANFLNHSNGARAAPKITSYEDFKAKQFHANFNFVTESHQYSLTVRECSLSRDAIYLNTATMFILMYSVTDRSSFETLSLLREKILLGKKSEIYPMVLVGNKTDLSYQREVTSQEGRMLAAQWVCPFFEITASVESNLLQLFEVAAKLSLATPFVFYSNKEEKLSKPKQKNKRLPPLAPPNLFTSVSTFIDDLAKMVGNELYSDVEFVVTSTDGNAWGSLKTGEREKEEEDESSIRTTVVPAHSALLYVHAPSALSFLGIKRQEHHERNEQEVDEDKEGVGMKSTSARNLFEEEEKETVGSESTGKKSGGSSIKRKKQKKEGKKDKKNKDKTSKKQKGGSGIRLQPTHMQEKQQTQTPFALATPSTTDKEPLKQIGKGRKRQRIYLLSKEEQQLEQSPQTDRLICNHGIDKEMLLGMLGFIYCGKLPFDANIDDVDYLKRLYRAARQLGLLSLARATKQFLRTCNHMSASPSLSAVTMAFRSILHSSTLSDVKLVIGAKQDVLYAHKVVLHCRSRRFAELLTASSSSSLRSNDTGVDSLLIAVPPSSELLLASVISGSVGVVGGSGGSNSGSGTGTSGEQDNNAYYWTPLYAKLLEFIYTDQVQVEGGVALPLLHLACEHKLDRLAYLCCKAYVQELTVQNAAEALSRLDKLADICHKMGHHIPDACLAKLARRVVQFISYRYSAVSKTKGFKLLSSRRQSELRRNKKEGYIVNSKKSSDSRKRSESQSVLSKARPRGGSVVFFKDNSTSEFTSAPSSKTSKSAIFVSSSPSSSSSSSIIRSPERRFPFDSQNKIHKDGDSEDSPYEEEEETEGFQPPRLKTSNQRTRAVMRMMKKIGGGRPGADPDYNEEVNVLEEEDDLLAMLEDEEEADAEANNNQSNYAKSNNSSEEFYDFGTYEEFLIAKVAESLRFIRRSSERAKAASELRWQQAINAFLQRQLLYQKEEENKTEEENHKKKQQMKDNDAKERADLFERERRSLEGKVKSALTANLCLFSVLGKKCSPIHLNVASKQKWYHCLDCEIVKSSVCCEVCARICHSGHRLVRKDTTGGEFDRGNLLMLRCECKEKLGMGECGPNGSRETYVWDNSLHGQHMRIENAATTVRKLQSSWYCIALGSVNGHGFTSGLHYWELTSEEAVEWTIGVATASITSMDNYLGNDRFSWAYETSGWIKHEANTMTYGEPFTDQDTMGILLDMDKHQLSFCKNGRNLGVAYHNISSTEEVFPAVAWRDGTVTVLPAQSTCRCMPKDEEELAVKLEASMEEDTTYLQLLDLSAKWSNSNTLGGSFSSNSRSRAIANPLSSSSSSSSEQLQQTKLCLISRDISLLSDKVEDLRLDGNELTDEAVEQLCRLTPSKLKRLHLSRNRLTKFPVALCSKPVSAFTSATAYSSSSFILSSSKNNHANTPSSSSHSNNNANANANLIVLQANNKHQQLNPLLTTERRASSPLISSPSLTHFTPSFSQLAFLDLSHNCLFPSLPFSIVQLSNLRILNLSHNKLSYLPRQFSQLTSLLELDLSSNLFSTPSPMETTQHIKKHERQRRCFLDCNHLPTSLTDLDLSNNPRVETYPSGLELCTRLTTLSLSGLPYLLSLDPTTQTNEKREDEPRADKKKADCLKAKQEYKKKKENTEDRIKNAQKRRGIRSLEKKRGSARKEKKGGKSVRAKKTRAATVSCSNTPSQQRRLQEKEEKGEEKTYDENERKTKSDDEPSQAEIRKKAKGKEKESEQTTLSSSSSTTTTTITTEGEEEDGDGLWSSGSYFEKDIEIDYDETREKEQEEKSGTEEKREEQNRSNERSQGLAALCSLTALDLSYCSKLQSLPKTIGEMTRLLSLDLRGCNSLCHLPDEMSKLTDLKVLRLNSKQPLTVQAEQIPHFKACLSDEVWSVLFEFLDVLVLHENSAPTGPFERLPGELIVRIFSMLSPWFIVTQLSFVCRRFHILSLEPSLWSNFPFHIFLLKFKNPTKPVPPFGRLSLDDRLRRIAIQYSQMTTLDLSGFQTLTTDLTPIAFYHLASKLKNLRHINLTGLQHYPLFSSSLSPPASSSSSSFFYEDEYEERQEQEGRKANSASSSSSSSTGLSKQTLWRRALDFMFYEHAKQLRTVCLRDNHQFPVVYLRLLFDAAKDLRVLDLEGATFDLFAIEEEKEGNEEEQEKQKEKKKLVEGEEGRRNRTDLLQRAKAMLFDASSSSLAASTKRKNEREDEEEHEENAKEKEKEKEHEVDDEDDEYADDDVIPKEASFPSLTYINLSDTVLVNKLVPFLVKNCGDSLTRLSLLAPSQNSSAAFRPSDAIFRFVTKYCSRLECLELECEDISLEEFQRFLFLQDKRSVPLPSTSSPLLLSSSFSEVKQKEETGEKMEDERERRRKIRRRRERRRERGCLCGLRLDHIPSSWNQWFQQVDKEIAFEHFMRYFESLETLELSSSFNISAMISALAKNRIISQHHPSPSSASVSIPSSSTSSFASSSASSSPSSSSLFFSTNDNKNTKNNLLPETLMTEEELEAERLRQERLRREVAQLDMTLRKRNNYTDAVIRKVQKRNAVPHLQSLSLHLADIDNAIIHEAALSICGRSKTSEDEEESETDYHDEKEKEEKRRAERRKKKKKKKRGVRRIDLSGCTGVLPSCIDAVLLECCGGGLQTLRCVDLGQMQVSDATVKRLAKAHGRTLRVLDLFNCSNVTDDGMLAIIYQCKKLQYLNGINTRTSILSVKASAEQLPQLRALGLSPYFPLEEVTLAFNEAEKPLEYLFFYGCPTATLHNYIRFLEHVEQVVDVLSIPLMQRIRNQYW